MVPPTCGAALLHEVGAVLRRQVLEDHAQAGKLLDPFRQQSVDEHLFAVENIDVGRDIFAVHQKRHADLFHALEHAHDFAVVGDAEGRIGRGMRRIKLHAGEHAVAKAALDVVGIGVVGEITGHQRLEFRALRHRRHDPLAIGDAVRRGAHRRHQVRHQNGTAEILRRKGQHRLEHFAVANVQVPVVRLADGDTRGHDGSYPLATAYSREQPRR